MDGLRDRHRSGANCPPVEGRLLATAQARLRTVAPSVSGQIVVILTVSDAGRSAVWYQQLVGARERSHYNSAGGTLQVVLEESASRLRLCLLSRHDKPADRFDEQRIALDHMELLVATRAALDSWAEFLELGIGHSGVKEPEYGSGAMVTLRATDNIQLDFYWLGP